MLIKTFSSFLGTQNPISLCSISDEGPIEEDRSHSRGGDHQDGPEEPGAARLTDVDVGEPVDTGGSKEVVQFPLKAPHSGPTVTR